MNKQLVHIVVEAKSSFGVKDKITGNWFNPTKALAKKLLPLFAVGSEYDVEMETSSGKDGKSYTNIVAIVSGKPSTTAPVAKAAPAKAAAPKPIQATVTTHVTPIVAINKDERILVQGLTQALLQSPVMSMVQTKDLISFVETNVVGLVEMVRRLAK